MDVIIVESELEVSADIRQLILILKRSEFEPISNYIDHTYVIGLKRRLNNGWLLDNSIQPQNTMHHCLIQKKILAPFFRPDNKKYHQTTFYKEQR